MATGPDPRPARVLVTRPAAQAATWVQHLRARGIEAYALPLLAIGPPADPAPVRAAWQTLAEQALVAFVSPNAVDRFFALAPRGAAWPRDTLAGSPGPGTSERLREHGVASGALVEPRDDAPQFDSEALWQQLAARDWQGKRALLVRGEGGREWLADTLRAHGARVETLCAYRRIAAEPDAVQQALLRTARADPAAHLWLFSSSEAIDRLLVLWPEDAATAWHALRAIATHPRIAQRAQALGIGEVHASRPELSAVVACIQSIGP